MVEYYMWLAWVWNELLLLDFVSSIQNFQTPEIFRNQSYFAEDRFHDDFCCIL